MSLPRYSGAGKELTQVVFLPTARDGTAVRAWFAREIRSQKLVRDQISLQGREIRSSALKKRGLCVPACCYISKFLQFKILLNMTVSPRKRVSQAWRQFPTEKLFYYVRVFYTPRVNAIRGWKFSDDASTTTDVSLFKIVQRTFANVRRQKTRTSILPLKRAFPLRRLEHLYPWFFSLGSSSL